MVNACLEEVNDQTIEKFIRWGSSGSEAMLDYPCCYFHIPESDGIIAYRVASNTAIVFGDPICPKADIPLITDAFHKYCKEAHLDIIYIIVSENFAKWVSREYCKIAVEVCEELIFDPSSFKKSKRLNYRLNQALKQGLTVHEYIPYDEKIERAILELGRHWKGTKKGPQLHLGHLNFFEHRSGKRWFYAKEGNEITGMAMLCRIDSKDGWLLKFLIKKPSATPFISELLMCEILETLNNENCHFLTDGMVPAASLVNIKGLSKISAWVANFSFKVVKKIFKLDQKKSYWLRYHPKVEPAYVLFNNHIGISGIRALIKVLQTD